MNIPINIHSGGNARSSVYSNEYRQDYENDSSTDEEPMEDNSSDEEEDFVSKYYLCRKVKRRKNIILASQVRKDLDSNLKEGQGEDQQL